MKIVHVAGKKIYDAQGFPLLLSEVWLDDERIITGYASIDVSLPQPLNAQEIRTITEAELSLALSAIEERVAPALLGKELRVPELDNILLELADQPSAKPLSKSVLTAVSMALYKAFAAQEQVELYELFAFLLGSDAVTLPCPQFTIMHGGTSGIDDFMIAPIGAITLREAIEMCLAIYTEVETSLKAQNVLQGTGRGGALLTSFSDMRTALDTLFEAVGKIIMMTAGQGMCAMALNVDATKNYNAADGIYTFGRQHFTSTELVKLYDEFIQTYPLYSIEDGLSKDDWEGWRALTETVGAKIQIVGASIFLPTQEQVDAIVQNNIATAVTIKPNQIGTISETLHIINTCKAAHLNTIIDYGTSEIEDTFLADLAVGTSAGQMKFGGCMQSEWIVKYQRLLVIEDSLRAGQAPLL